MPGKDHKTNQTEKAPAKRQSPHRVQPEPVLLQEPGGPEALQRTILDPGQARPSDLLTLQRIAGNQTVLRLIQARLTVGPVGDRYELEADRVAERVMKMDAQPGPGVQRQEEGEEVQTKSLVASITPLVQRQEEEDEEEVKTKPLAQRRVDGGFEAGLHLASRLAASRGCGSPLPNEVRVYMEPRFGADFSGVRLHTGGDAVQLSKELKARAFTHGQNIYLGAGHADPRSVAGRRLLAHELTHVVQQNPTQVQRIADSPAAAITPAAAAPEIQRMLWKNTNWPSATQAEASAGGGVGVLFVKDNPTEPTVVVKSGEEAAPEVEMAAKLHSGLWGTAEGGAAQTSAAESVPDWGITTPRARMVSSREAEIMKDALKRNNFTLLTGDENLKSRAKKIINNISADGTIVFEYATGMDFKELLEGQKHTRRRKFRRWKRTARASSPLIDMLKDKGYIRSLGKLTAIDLFTGNYDRLTGLFNPENWKVNTSTKTIQLVDNVQMNLMFAFRNFIFTGNETREAKDFYTSWKNNQRSKNLANGNFPAIAEEAFETLKGGIVGDEVSKPYVRAQDVPFLTEQLNKSESNIVTWFADGVREGKRLLLAAGENHAVIYDLPESVRVAFHERINFLKPPAQSNEEPAQSRVSELAATLHAGSPPKGVPKGARSYLPPP